MSKATVTGQITVTSNGTTLHTILQCTTGDVYQNYDGDPASPSNVVPNFEASGATKIGRASCRERVYVLV